MKIPIAMADNVMANMPRAIDTHVTHRGLLKRINPILLKLFYAPLSLYLNVLQLLTLSVRNTALLKKF
jgi:hypothetical protein